MGYMEGQEYQKEKGYNLIFWLEDRVGYRLSTREVSLFLDELRNFQGEHFWLVNTSEGCELSSHFLAGAGK